VLIPQLPADFPVPVAMVLHMPVGYTELYAKKLDEMSNLRVKEAAEGDLMRAGHVYLAPAGRHLSFRRAGAEIVAHLDVRPLDTPHRPAVDVMFHSAADVYGARVLAVVMTGMGADGREGSAWIKARGGQVLTEAEQSCVVYGMPRSVVEAGLSDANAPLETLFAHTGESMNRRILVVDDSGLARRRARAILESAGFEVIEAEDGIAALESYFVSKPDVVLLDLVMKGMYGLDVLARLREIDPGARVIVVSADVQTSSHELVAQGGAAGFLVKPVDANEVLTLVQSVLGE
jgi:chemotaxis response regulator CheB